MATQRTGQYRQLPLIPKALLRQHRAFEKFDNRFRACARLLQALSRRLDPVTPGAAAALKRGNVEVGAQL